MCIHSFHHQCIYAQTSTIQRALSLGHETYGFYGSERVDETGYAMPITE